MSSDNDIELVLVAGDRDGEYGSGARLASMAALSPYERVKKVAGMVDDAETPVEVKHERLRAIVKYGYGLPQFSTLSLTLIIAIYANTLYEQFGASLSTLAFFTALARSFDVVTDPIMGWISDSTRLKFGRRRPYMLVGCWGYALMFVLLLSPPLDKVGNRTSTWFGIFYIAFYLFDTLANVPYSALGPELTTDSAARTKIFFYGKLYSGIGTLMGATAPEVIRQIISSGYDDGSGSGDGAGLASDGTSSQSWSQYLFGFEPEGLVTIKTSFFMVGVIFGGLYLIGMNVVVWNIKERKVERGTSIPLVPSMLRSFKNIAFRPLLLGWILDAVALATLASTFPFFIIYVIKPNPDVISAKATQAACFAALFIGAIISMPIWKFLASKFGRYRVWMAFNLTAALTNAGYAFVGEGDPLSTIGLTFINGLPLGGQFLTDSILADVIDYDEFLNGSRNEGGFTVFASFIPKFVAVPSGALPLAAMAMIGFVASDENGNPSPQPPAVGHFIRFMFVVVPVACTLASFFAKRKYPLKKASQVAELANGIELHKQGLPARDPITGELIELLVLDEKEEKQAFVLDNFTFKQLRAVLARRSAKPLIKRMTLNLCTAIGFLVGFACLVYFFFDRLDDPVLSIVPILSVVFAGISFTIVGVSIMRLKAAIALRESKLNIALVEKIIEHKEKGSRGGGLINQRYEVMRLQELIADMEDDVTSARRYRKRARALDEYCEALKAQVRGMGVEPVSSGPFFAAVASSDDSDGAGDGAGGNVDAGARLTSRHSWHAGSVSESDDDDDDGNNRPSGGGFVDLGSAAAPTQVEESFTAMSINPAGEAAMPVPAVNPSTTPPPRDSGASHDLGSEILSPVPLMPGGVRPGAPSIASVLEAATLPPPSSDAPLTNVLPDGMDAIPPPPNAPPPQ